MPSSQTRKATLNRKIQQLEELGDLQDGLSPANTGHLAFLRLWREFAGKDIVLVIRPKGVLHHPNEVAKAKIVEVHDQVAADLIAFAPNRQQVVRRANEKEIAAYRERSRRQQVAARQAAAAAAKAAADAQYAVNHGLAPATVSAEPIPDVEIDDSTMVPALDAEADAMVADIPGADGEGVGNDIAGIPAPPFLSKNVTPKQQAALLAAGFDTVEKIAAAEPKELQEVNGVGPLTSAKLVVAASEAVNANE